MNDKNQFDVAKVAVLARLDLKKDEEEQLHGDMEGIVGYINMLTELDVDGVEPTAHAVPLTNVCRDDVEEKSFPRDAMLANAPDLVDDELIKVHQVIDSHSTCTQVEIGKSGFQIKSAKNVLSAR